jgi:hypothetical protein
MFALPMITVPAAWSLRTTVASVFGTRSRHCADTAAVRTPGGVEKVFQRDWNSVGRPLCRGRGSERFRPGESLVAEDRNPLR